MPARVLKRRNRSLEAGAIAEMRLEGGTAVRDQVIAGFAQPCVIGMLVARCAGGGVRHGHRLLGDIELRMPRTAGEPLDGAAIAVAGGKIVIGEVASGAQDGIDQAHLLE